jgi:hypothetical protein
MKSLLDLYAGKRFSGTSGKIDMEYVRKYFKEKDANVLFFLNCNQFSIACCNNECRGVHKLALDTNQTTVYEKLLTDTKNEWVKGSHLPYLEKMDIQNILQTYTATENYNMVEIKIEKTKNKDAAYLEKYIKETDKFNTPSAFEEEADGVVYVRAETNSDYDHFTEQTKLRNVTACDTLQEI